MFFVQIDRHIVLDALGLVPSVIQESQITAEQLTDLGDLYKDDLPSLQLFFAEFERWKM